MTLNLPSVADLDLLMPRHPHTGKLLVPIYLTRNGRHVWPILGAAEDDAPSADDLTDPDAEGDSAEDDESRDDDKAKDEDEEPSVPQWKYDKIMVRMQNADKRSSALEKELAELKKSGMDKAGVDSKLKEDNDRLVPQIAKLTADNNDLRLQVAFLSANDISWVDPQAALRLADLSEVEIDEGTGKVDVRALKAALKQLARDKKYLVKPEAKNEDEDQTASGPKMHGKRKGDKGNPDLDKKALAKRFPALNASR